MSKLVKSFTVFDKIVVDTGKRILNHRVFEYDTKNKSNQALELYLINDNDEVVHCLYIESDGHAEGTSSVEWANISLGG